MRILTSYGGLTAFFYRIIIAFLIGVLIIAIPMFSGLTNSFVYGETITTEENSAVTTGNPWIQVGLLYGSSATAACTLKSDTGFMLGYILGGGGYQKALPLQGYTEIVVIPENGNLSVRDTGGTVLYENLGSQGLVLPYDARSGIFIGDGAYRGGIRFELKGGNLNVINYIDLEEYLYGVLNGEMNFKHPIEALKAQAVTARSFTLGNLGKHKSEGFDFCSGTHCQMYKGMKDEQGPTTQAVDETKGIVLRYGDTVVPGYYFKNSGGYTQNIEDVWGSGSAEDALKDPKKAYLRGKKDEYSPVYSWNVSYTFSELQDKLFAAGYPLGTLSSVSVAKRNLSGGVEILKLTGTEGSREFSKEKIRSFLGQTAVKSTMFQISADQSGSSLIGSGNSETVNPGTQVPSQPANLWFFSSSGQVALPQNSVCVMGAFGVLENVDINKFYVIGADGKTQPVKNTIAANPNPTNGQTSNRQTGTAGSISADCNTVTGDKVFFYGQGYGHGVGMPQDSAIAMATKGFTYEDILKYYYTGVEVK